MRSMEAVMKDAGVLFDFLSDGGPGPDRADFVLAMGSQDLGVADTAARAFQEARAGWLVCSGGLGKDTAALFSQPEGELYAQRCLALGVPEDRLIVERDSTNSGENFRFTRAALEERGIFPKTGVIACKPYMAKRALAVGAFQWPEVQWSVFPTKPSLSEYTGQGDIRPVLELMAGDLQRLRVYAGRFQAPVEVPEPVWAAYERLAGDGYDRYVVREI